MEKKERNISHTFMCRTILILLFFSISVFCANKKIKKLVIKKPMLVMPSYGVFKDLQTVLAIIKTEMKCNYKNEALLPELDHDDQQLEAGICLCAKKRETFPCAVYTPWGKIPLFPRSANMYDDQQLTALKQACTPLKKRLQLECAVDENNVIGGTVTYYVGAADDVQLPPVKKRIKNIPVDLLIQQWQQYAAHYEAEMTEQEKINKEKNCLPTSKVESDLKVEEEWVIVSKDNEKN